VNVKRLVGMAGIIGLCFSSFAWAAEAEKDAATPVSIVGIHQPETKRPALLPAMYAGFVAVQAWDVYTTSAALKNGAREANPAFSSFAGNSAKTLGFKAATTASTIFFVERMWKRNRVGAVVLLAAVNGATAAIAMHNARNARVGR